MCPSLTEESELSKHCFFLIFRYIVRTPIAAFLFKIWHEIIL